VTLGPTEHGRPLRAVVFTGGPVLDDAVREFVDRLERQPEIELAAVFCETGREGFGGVVADLWRRRGPLAAPLLLQRAGLDCLRFLRAPAGRLARRRRLAALAGRIHPVADLHAGPVVERIRRLDPDLGLIYGGPILRPELFDLPRWGTLGIHHGKVPEYRGKKTTFWAIYNGEPEAGVTIQHVGGKLDRGAVVARGTVRTGRRLPGRVWSELERLGLDLYVDAVVRVRSGRAEAAPQTGRRRKLYRDPGLSDIASFWWRYALRWLGFHAGARR